MINLLITTMVETILQRLYAFSTTTSIILVWDPLTPVSSVTYEYEVAYSVDSVCSSDHGSLPDGYTLYYPRTSNHYIEVVGLMSGSCYVFGVRAYTSVTDSPGEFSLIQGNTISEGWYCMQNNLFTFCIFILDQPSSTAQSSTGLIAGSVTLSIVIVVLVGLLIVVTVGLLYNITKRYWIDCLLTKLYFEIVA